MICPEEPQTCKVLLICTKCGRTFKTKNIGVIGSRTIFPIGEDCPHPITDLKPICRTFEDCIEEWRELMHLFKSQNRSTKEVRSLLEYEHSSDVVEKAMKLWDDMGRKEALI